VGIGVDLVNIPRFSATLRSMPQLQDLYFVPAELDREDGRPRSEASLAARFAAKEAVAKALGLPPGMSHRDCVVLTDHDGQPWLEARGSVLEAARSLGVQRWHMSLSQEGTVAMAQVIAEGQAYTDSVELP